MSDTSHPLSGYQVGNVGFFGLPQTFDPRLDVRGVLWLWELPRKDATYVIGADPTQGVTGWTPQTSTDSDRKIDNASIEVLRVGRIRLVQTGKEARQVREPDVQVAEFAAPIDAIAFAHVINAVGKLYRGDSDEEGCLVNIEVYPGPGIATFPELYAKLGYVNIFRQPYLDGSVKRKIDFGFTASQQSKQLLWTQGVRHLRKNGVKINSPWLLEELVDAVASNFITSTWRSDPQHDDRFTGLLLSLWAAHSWAMDLSEVEETHLQPIQNNIPDFQRSLISLEKMKEAEAERWDMIQDALTNRG